MEDKENRLEKMVGKERRREMKKGSLNGRRREGE